MRGGKSFLLLVVVALVLGAYIFFVESKRNPDAGATTGSKPVFAALTADKISDIEVHGSGGEVTHLEKQGGKWRIVGPVAVDADANAASGLTSTLAGLTAESTVVDKPASVKEYGLDPAQSSVTFTTDDKQSHTLLLGGKAPAGGDVYAQVKGQPAVFLIGSYNGDSLNKTTFDLRDKTALSFPRDTADLLTLDHDHTTLTLQKKGQSDWRLTSPVAARADFSVVDGAIGRLADLQMKSIVAPDVAKVSAADLKKYGLDKPAVTATVGAGSTRATLAVGAKTSDNQEAYARDLSRPMVFTVEASLIDDLEKKPFDVRLKDLFAAKSYSIISVAITQGGTTTEFVKVKNADNSETWKQAKPADKAVDQTKMGDLVSAVTGLQAQSFVDRPAAGGETIVIATTYGDPAAPTSEQVTFHKTDKTVQAVRTDDAGAAVVSTDDFNKVFTALKALSGGK